MADTNYNKEYVFFKDITPIIVESDRSSGSGFTNLNRLTTILHSWGFSDVNASNVTEWKISGKNQYTDQGPRLEWKGSLFVKRPGLDLLKCKNKDKTSFQTCTDIQGDNYILLNTHASGYAGATWKWIHISEFGFAIRQDKCYLSSGKSTMNNIVEFMTEKQETPKIETNISKDNKVFPESIANYTWPIGSYYVPNYLINNNNINGWGNTDSIVNTKNFDYRIYIDYGTSEANSHRVYNFNLVDEAAVVIYSDMDEDLSRDNTLNTIEYTDNGVYINDVCKFEWFNPAKDLLLIATSNGMNIENSNYKYTINLKTSGNIPGGNNFTPQTRPSISVSIPTNLYYNYTTEFNWKWYSFFDIEKNTKYILKDVISNKKEATLLTNKINHLYTRDYITITGKFSEPINTGTIKGNSKIWVDYEDCRYTISGMSFSLSKKQFTTNYGLHVKGNREKYTYDFNFLNNSPDSKIFQINDNCSFSDYQPGYSYAASKSYNITRGYWININNNLLRRFSITEKNNVSKTDDYLYGKMGDKVYRKENIGFNDAHEYISRNSKLWAIVCIKNYFVKNPLIYPTMKLYTSGNSLGCEITNSLSINTNFKYMQSTNIRHSTDISPNNTKTLWFDYGWSSQSLIDESFIKYEHPLLGEQSIPFSNIPRKYNNNLSLYRYLEGSDHIILVHNNTSQPTTVSVYNKNMSSPLESLTSTKNQDFIRLENYESALSDYLDNLTVKYYHPDKCQWFSVKFQDIPTLTLVPNGSVSELHEIYESSGIGSGTAKTYSVQTNITAEVFDVLSVKVSSYEGFYSPQAIFQSKEKVNGKWKVTYLLSWNGGGPSYARVKTAIHCARYISG